MFFFQDVDPKSILCVFFKQGMCSKGDKCKWSHDLEIERKSEKRNIYVDKRGDWESFVYFNFFKSHNLFL